MDFMQPGCTRAFACRSSNLPLPAAPTAQQGDYSIRRISAAAEAEVQQLASEATPQPQSLIAAYPSSGTRSAAATAGGGEGLSAAKTPVLHLNPLADYL